jgi:hypothetical protein
VDQRNFCLPRSLEALCKQGCSVPGRIIDATQDKVFEVRRESNRYILGGGGGGVKTTRVSRMHKPEERQSKAGCGVLKAPLLKILVKYYTYEFAKVQ